MAGKALVGGRLVGVVLVGVVTEACKARANPTGLPELVVASLHQTLQLEHKKLLVFQICGW